MKVNLNPSSVTDAKHFEVASHASRHLKTETEAAPVVVIGGGPSGIRVAQELSQLGIDVKLFNAERWKPYNRVKLTPLLSGDVQLGQVEQALDFRGPGKVSLYSDNSIVAIDRQAKSVTTKHGRSLPYSKLVLCTGSRANFPPITGIELPGIFSFRNFDDVEKLVARTFSSRRCVVVGGGLLGLEAARGMNDRASKPGSSNTSPILCPATRFKRRRNSKGLR